MRHTDAWSRWQLHEIPMSVPSVHATADFIGDTWLTTTMFSLAARSTSPAHAVRTRRSSVSSDSPPSGTNPGSSRHLLHASELIAADGWPSYTP